MAATPRAMRLLPRLAALVVLAAGARAHAFDTSKLEFERSIENVTAAGLYRVPVDPELYRHARAADLGDVRIVGPDEAEIPWLVRRVPAPQKIEPRAVTVVDATALADGSVRAVVDFGAAARKHSEITLAVDAAGDWVRTARLELSRDGETWTRETEGAYLFRIEVDGRRAEQTTVDYPPSEARFVRVTLLPSASGPPVRIAGVTAAFVPPEAHVPPRLLPSVKPTPLPQPGDATTSVWMFDLGAAGVPIADLALDLADASFERPALLAAAPHDGDWSPVGATLLHRVPPVTAGRVSEENVRISAGRTRARRLRLTVYNGDGAPLSLRTVSPGYDAEELVFRAPAAGAYTLYVGGELPAPRSTLADELARSGEQPTLTASLGTTAPNPAYGHLAPPPAPPGSERHPLPLVVVLAIGALLTTLALWTLRRLKRARS